MPDDSAVDYGTEYIDATDYKKLVTKINNLYDVAFDLTAKSLATRKLRYVELDLEVERKAGRLAPDEIYTPIHVIDTNIRREQSQYVQYVTQSPRAVILKDRDDPANDLSLLEVDLTEKLRFDGWQLATYANIDGFQSYGYGVMETIMDQNNPGEIGREYVQFGDFSFIADTRDLQKCEMIGRAYYFTKTKLHNLTNRGLPDDRWDRDQTEKLLKAEPNDEQSQIYSGTTTINRSLYKVFKIMFRVKGTVFVGWACPKLCDDWLRKPRELYLGRRTIRDDIIKQSQNPLSAGQIDPKYIAMMQKGLPPSDEEYETEYPYVLYPYLISENDTISNLKGRTFLDQDTQNAATSLLSCTLTKARRSSILAFSKDTTDPNDDFLMQKNIILKQGALINGKVKEFSMEPPDAQMFTAINTLISINQQETSQINFAENNRQADSRKTATAIKASISQAQQLSSTQITLFSMALKKQYTYESMIIRSRVMAGLIKVSPVLAQMYAKNWTVKPSGDTDVIEKQQMVEKMTEAWPIMSQTACASLFLADLLEKMFPDSAAKYVQALQQADQQKQSQQQQMMQQGLMFAKQLGTDIIGLAKKPEMFSESGLIHVYPQIENLADKAKQLMAQLEAK